MVEAGPGLLRTLETAAVRDCGRLMTRRVEEVLLGCSGASSELACVRARVEAMSPRGKAEFEAAAACVRQRVLPFNTHSASLL